MFKRLALAVVLLIAVAPVAEAQTVTTPPSTATGRSSAQGSVQVDPAKKAWFDKTIEDFFDGGPHQNGRMPVERPLR